MADFMADLASVYNVSNSGVQLTYGTTEDKTSLDMTDFLNLMVVSLQNQTIDDTMDTSEMMNQMVQMSVIQAVNDLTTLINDSTTLTYAASLVGKEVVMGRYDAAGALEEIPGVVSGTGTIGGEQVLFLEGSDGEYWHLSDILAIGKLPESADELTDSAEESAQAVESVEEAAEQSAEENGENGTEEKEAVG